MKRATGIMIILALLIFSSCMANTLYKNNVDNSSTFSSSQENNSTSSILNAESTDQELLPKDIEHADDSDGIDSEDFAESPPKNIGIEFKGYLYPAYDEKTELWGYIKEDGEWQINPEYDAVEHIPSRDSLADYKLFAVKKDDLWGYVNYDGYMVIEPQYYFVFGRFYNDLSFGQHTKEGSSIYFNNQGQILESPLYNAFFSSEGLYLAFDDEKNLMGYKNENNEWELVPIYNYNGYGSWDSYSDHHFHEGLAVYTSIDYDNKMKLYGYMNRNGSVEIQPIYIYASPFTNSLASVSTIENNYGVIDKSGKWVIEPTFQYIGKFENDLAPARNNNSRFYGYINLNGDWLIEPIYTSAEDFVGDLAYVKTEDLHGYINTSGEMVYSWSEE